MLPLFLFLLGSDFFFNYREKGQIQQKEGGNYQSVTENNQSGVIHFCIKSEYFKMKLKIN